MKGAQPSLTPPFTTPYEGDFSVSGWDMLGRWEQQETSGRERSVQMYFDRARHHLPESKWVAETFDLDFQQQQPLQDRHNLIWGLGYRHTASEAQGDFWISFEPARHNTDLLSAFVHDEITLQEDLHLAVGSKIEHNDYTGLEVQPNVRLTWTPEDNRTLWMAVSRAVRTPSLAERDLRANLAVFPGEGGLPTAAAVVGNKRFEAEDLIAYEWGYRTEPAPSITLDVAAFYNVYRHLRSEEPREPFLEATPAPAHLVLPRKFANRTQGQTYGLEVASNWQVRENWQLTLGYSLLEAQGNDYFQAQLQSPRQQLHLRSSLDLPGDLEFDTAFYSVSHLSGLASGALVETPGYTRWDVRLGWHPREDLEVSVGAQNLFDPKHQEFGPYHIQLPNDIERNFYLKLTSRF